MTPVYLYELFFFLLHNSKYPINKLLRNGNSINIFNTDFFFS